MILELPNYSEAVWIGIIGAIATFAGAVATIIAVLITKKRKRGKIEIVEISVSDKSVEVAKTITKFPIIDVTVKNTGDKTSVITRAEFKVRKVWHLVLQFPFMMGLDISEEYDVKIDPKEKPPYTKQIKISHVLKSDEADRFSFNFGLIEPKAFESIYHISLKLIYDSRRKTEEKDIVVVLPDTSHSSPMYFFDEFNKKWTHHKAQVWGDEEIKKIADSLFNEEVAKQRDKYNRNLLREAANVGGARNYRVSELIGKID